MGFNGLYIHRMLKFYILNYQILFFVLTVVHLYGGDRLQERCTRNSEKHITYYIAFISSYRSDADIIPILAPVPGTQHSNCTSGNTTPTPLSNCLRK